MSRVRAVKPDPRLSDLLPGAQFADAYGVVTAEPGLRAETAAHRMFDSAPAWANGLMALRDIIVTPLGLKTSRRQASLNLARIGIFPIQSVTPSRIVLGFEDSHLDFRAVVDVAALEGGSLVTTTTVVRLNNLLGRLYLAAILPFHILIVRSMLKKLG